MIEKTLASYPHITIKYSLSIDVLLVDWTGDQSRSSVMDGCEKILNYLRQYRCTKVLNDNTHVTSIWADASEWVATDWFPRMQASGCRLFAWVYSPNLYSKLSTDQTLLHGSGGVIAITFENSDTALAWLIAME